MQQGDLFDPTDKQQQKIDDITVVVVDIEVFPPATSESPSGDGSGSSCEMPQRQANDQADSSRVTVAQGLGETDDKGIRAIDIETVAQGVTAREA